MGAAPAVGAPWNWLKTVNSTMATTIHTATLANHWLFKANSCLIPTLTLRCTWASF